MIDPGAVLTLEVEKAAAGGRMLARHHGQVVLVWGAIPGERVHARVERIGKGVVFAETVEVVTASPDRRHVDVDWRCGGQAYVHIDYPRQLGLKAEIIRDAFGRIGQLSLPATPTVVPSPERGYRMRARLHAEDGRLGLFREGTRELCAASETGQFLPDTKAWIQAAQEHLQGAAGLAGLEIAENLRGDQRACHLELSAGTDSRRFVTLSRVGPLVGLSAHRADRTSVERLDGVPAVSDVLHGRAGDSASAFRLRRDVRSFFQGNRFLLEPLVRHVVTLVPPGPVVDLYAGVGLFGLSLAAAGAEQVTVVEDDPVSAGDLQGNAEPFGARVHVERRSVEAYLGTGRDASSVPADRRRGSGSASSATAPDSTWIVDPPRTGLSKDALAGIVRTSPQRLVYVSCDVATLARDTRLLLAAGFEFGALTGFDLFPNTAHVESVAVFTCASGRPPQTPRRAP